MKQPIKINYDGNTVRFDSLADEVAFKNHVIDTVRSYTSCRAKYLIEQRHISAAVWSVDLLRHFTGAYANHSLLAVAKKCLALKDQLYVLMPSPTGKQSYWCDRIELILKISQAIINDEKYYLSGSRYGQAARPGQFFKGGTASN